MTVAHPTILVVAVVAALLVLPYLARAFFGNRDQFIDDVGLSDRANYPRLIVDLLWWFWFFPGRGIWFNILWFLVALAIAVAVTYNLLVLFIEVIA